MRVSFAPVGNHHSVGQREAREDGIAMDTATLQLWCAGWGVQLLILTEKGITVTQSGGYFVHGVAFVGALAVDIKFLQCQHICIDVFELFDDPIQFVSPLYVPLLV